MKRPRFQHRAGWRLGVFVSSLFWAVSSQAQGNCATFSNTELAMPCLGVSGSYLSTSWNLYQAAPLRFRLDLAEPTTSQPNCADFNTQTSVARLPCVSVNGTDFWADLRLINTNPIEVEVSAFGQGSGNGTYLVTGADMAYSASEQATVASQLNRLDATVKQALVAVNELLYTDATKTSYDEFDRRRKTATAALTMMDAQTTSLKSAATRSRSQPAARPLPVTRDGVAGGTFSLGISARADDLQTRIDKVADITSGEAKRLQRELSLEINSVQAANYASAGTMYDLMAKTAFAVQTGAKIASMVGTWYIAGPAMASTSMATQIGATGAVFLDNLSGAVGIVNDYAVFAGDAQLQQDINKSGITMLTKANTLVEMITLKGATSAETRYNSLQVIDGVLDELGYANINLLDNDTATVETQSCGNRSVRAGGFCPTTAPTVAPQLRAGNYQDPETGATVVSTGLDSDWESDIRSLPDQVLWPSYNFNRAELVFTGFVPVYRNVATGTEIRPSYSYGCSGSNLAGSVVGNKFSGSYSKSTNDGYSSSSITETGQATIDGATRQVDFEVDYVSSGETFSTGNTGEFRCSYTVYNFPLTYLDQNWGMRDASVSDITGQAACDLVSNFSYYESGYERAGYEFVRIDCTNALLSVTLKVQQ